jgi:hypothetical protein
MLKYDIIYSGESMKTLNIRNIDDVIYAKIKEESKKAGMSINKYLVFLLEETLGKKREILNHDLDDFFGTWSDEEYNLVIAAVEDSRTIDEDMWK